MAEHGRMLSADGSYISVLDDEIDQDDNADTKAITLADLEESGEAA